MNRHLSLWLVAALLYSGCVDASRAPTSHPVDAASSAVSGKIDESGPANPKDVRVEATRAIVAHTNVDGDQPSETPATVQQADQPYLDDLKGENSPVPKSVPETSSSDESVIGKAPPVLPAHTEIKLNDTVTDSAIGGRGQYWCLLLPESQQVAVFNVNVLEAVRYIPLSGGNAKIAAGRKKLLIAYPESQEIVRYNLETLELEATAALSFKGNIRNICLGSDCDDLMLVCYATKVTFLNINTLTETTLEHRRPPPDVFHVHPRWPVHFRSSPDGRLYGAWTTLLSSTSMNSIIVAQGGTNAHWKHGNFGNMLATGNERFLTAAGVFSSDLKPIKVSDEFEWQSDFIPSQYGNWFLGITPLRFSYPQVKKPPLPPGATIYDDNCEPLGSLGDIGITLGNDFDTATDFTQDKRVLFSPYRGLIAWLTPTNDALHLYKFDLEVMLKMSGKDYLLVSSQPPKVEVGKPYNYTITVLSTRGGVKFKLDDGPSGMVISTDGTVTWNVPMEWAEGNAIIVISDQSGQESFHVIPLGVD